MKIILASASPRRKALLQQIGLEFDVLVTDTSEENGMNMEPDEVVMLNAEKKACDAAKKLLVPALIIAADTVVEQNGIMLNKPRDEDDAFKMLTMLSGRKHTVHTGVCLYLHGENIEKRLLTERADVFMREISESEINRYIKTGEPMDKAGSYGLQGFGAVFVRRVEGDYNTVIGLPLCAFWNELKFFSGRYDK